MPLYSATCPLPKNQMLRRHQASAPFSPIDIAGISLWLKADTGVTFTTYTYISNIALSSAGQTTINGNYTPSSTPAINSNYTLSGPNNNRIEVRPNSSPVYRLYNTDNYVDGGPSYYDFTSTNGTTWSFGDGKRPVSITISGLTGASATANGAYGPFEGAIDGGTYWLAYNNEELGVLKVYQNGDCELFRFISGSPTLIATGSNWGIGSFTIVSPATGSPTGSGTIYPTGGAPTGVVTTTNANSTNVTGWSDQSGNGNNCSSPNNVEFSSSPYPNLYFDGADSEITLHPDVFNGFSALSLFAVWNIVNNENGGILGSDNNSNFEIITQDDSVVRMRNNNYDSNINTGGLWYAEEFSLSTITADSAGGGSGTARRNGSTTGVDFDDASIEALQGGQTYKIGVYGGSYFTELSLAELIVYSGKLNGSQIDQVEAYLNAKYAIY